MVKLRVHPNVVALDEERRRRERCTPFVMCVPPPWFVARCTAPAEPAQASHPAAQALLAGVMLGIGERDKDAAMIAAGKRLAEAAQKGQPAASGRRWPAKWLRTFLGLSKR
jgi:hypothetical protein